MGWFSDDPVLDEWKRDQVERGGTRASATLQQENKGESSSRYDWIAKRAVNAGGDRRSGEERRST